MPRSSDLRVLSGRFKGWALKSPQSALTHPMGSREKLALFNMLQSYLNGANVLDAYAGTGALGIEALSHGAEHVDFVEKSPQIARTIRENLQNLPDSLGYDIYIGSVQSFAQQASAGKYDLILADPPYDKFDPGEVAMLAELLKSGGVLALSFPFFAGTPEISGLELHSSRKYAAAGIAIYRRLD